METQLRGGSFLSAPTISRARSSQSTHTLARPFTVAGRFRPTQRRPGAAACQASLPVLERLHAPLGQNSIVPAPTLGGVRPIEEVGRPGLGQHSQHPWARSLSVCALPQVEQEPPVPLYVSLCDEIVAACHRQPEVSLLQHSTPH